MADLKLVLLLTLTLVVLVASEPGYRRGYGQGYGSPHHHPASRHYAGNGPRSYSGSVGRLWRPSFGGYRHGQWSYGSGNGAGFHRRDHGHRYQPAYGHGHGQGGNQYMASGSSYHSNRYNNPLAGHLNNRGFAYGHGSLAGRNSWRYGHGK